MSKVIVKIAEIVMPLIISAIVALIEKSIDKKERSEKDLANIKKSIEAADKAEKKLADINKRIIEDIKKAKSKIGVIEEKDVEDKLKELVKLKKV